MGTPNTTISQLNKVDQVGCIIINATGVKRARLAVGWSACNPRIRIIALESLIHFHLSPLCGLLHPFIYFDAFNALFQLAPVEQIPK